MRYPKKKKVTFRQIWYRKLSSVFHRLQGCESERKTQNFLFTLKSNRVTIWEGQVIQQEVCSRHNPSITSFNSLNNLEGRSYYSQYFSREVTPLTWVHSVALYATALLWAVPRLLHHLDTEANGIQEVLQRRTYQLCFQSISVTA